MASTDTDLATSDTIVNEHDGQYQKFKDRVTDAWIRFKVRMKIAYDKYDRRWKLFQKRREQDRLMRKPPISGRIRNWLVSTFTSINKKTNMMTRSGMDKSKVLIHRLKDDGSMTTVSGIGEVRACCWQSARLHDRVCICGRAVPKKYLEQFD